MVKSYRVFIDEPLGVAVGFEPKGFGFEYDEIEVDDGGGDDFYILNDGTGFITSLKPPMKDVDGSALWPEPDALIWRSIRELEEFINDFSEQIN